MAEMTAVILHGKQDLRLERTPVPHAAPGEIVLQVGAALTCGTDLKVYRRGYHAMMLTPPVPFGHELAGTIVELGSDVTGFALGDRVVALNSAPCDRCFFCLHHQQNLCEDLLFNNGAYAEYLRIPARIVAKNTLKLPSSLPFEHAALTEPLACVVRGYEQSNVRSGDTMAVLGAGPIGLMFVHVAALAGVEVIAVVKHPVQAAAARRFGAAHVVQISSEDSAQTTVDAVRALTPGARGADVVIEAVATPATWQQAVAMVRKGGTVNFFGGPPSGTVVALDTNRLHYGDITLVASFHHTPATSRTAFALLSGERFQSAAFITGAAPLERVPAVFAAMLSRSSASALDIKTAIYPAGMPPDEAQAPAVARDTAGATR